jgi:hypothetical protein
MFASKDLFFSKPSGYQISRSVRLRSSASAYLNRTNGTPTSTTTTTLSLWLKRGTIGIQNNILGAGQASGTNYSQFTFDSGSALIFSESGTPSFNLTTTQVFRDPSAWYHIVFVYDSTQATASNRAKIYVNGVQVTAFSTANYPALNQATYFNTNAYIKAIGNIWYNGAPGGFYFDGYLTEVNFIDGQALTPSSFGQTNTITGVWQPLKYTGTYGTNGFYLNFSDNSNNTATTIGKDYSGNGNNWTPNNISVTAGATYDSMLDVPTPFADGGNGRGNYCTLNPTIQRWVVPNSTFSNANLSITTTVASGAFGFGTMFMSTGKWYWEGTLTAAGTATPGTGLADNQVQSGTFTNLIEYNKDGTRTGGASWATYTTNDVIGVAMDCDNLLVYFYKNNTLQGSIALTSGVAYAPLMDVVLNASWAANFGQRPFSYTPPTGFVALNTQNLPTPTISNGANYMAATLYTGNGSTQSLTNTVNGISFQPDLVWVKARSLAYSNYLYDSVRGTGTSKSLISDATAVEGAGSANANLTSFDASGFSLGTTSGTNGMNANAGTFVGWQWNAGGSTVTNTNGSISTQVRANTTAGFSVVTYTGNGTGGATVGHGLGVAPKLIIIKNRGVASNWIVMGSLLGVNKYLLLQASNAVATGAPGYDNGTLATSSVFTIGSQTDVNTNGNSNVAYCFAEVAGYSKFGSYTGNGSADGPFVYCGFRPRWIMVKRTDSTGGWNITDTSMATYNLAQPLLQANTSAAEVSAFEADILSNGFKYRGSSTNVLFDHNLSGATYIFVAFAENPFKNSLAR